MKRLILAAALWSSSLTRGLANDAPPAPAPAVDVAARERLAGVERPAAALYAAAREANWKEAKRQSRALVSAVMTLENPADKARQPLLRAMGKLAQAVRARDGLATMHAANRVLQWTGQRNTGDPEPAAASVSAGLARLEFLARELEIAARGGVVARSMVLAVKLRTRWAEQRPALTGRVGAPEIDGYDGLILRLADARGSADFAETAVSLQQAGQRLRAALREPGRAPPPLP